MATNNSRQALWIGLGSFFSFLVGIISPMILSRVFTKADYGTFKQVMFVYNTLLMVFTLGLPKAYAYFLPKYSRDYSKDIINKITYLFIGMGVLFSIVLISFSSLIADILNNKELTIAIRYFAPTPLFLLPTIGLEGIYAAFKKTQYITIYTIFTRTLTVFMTILPVFLLNGTYIHAIIGFDIASFLTCIVALLMKNYPVRYESHAKSPLSFKQILQFSIPLMIASIWGVIIGSSSQFFISRFYGKEVFADFSNGFMEIPFATMVLSAVATVLLPRFSEMEEGERKNDDVYNLWNSALEKSAKIIFPILVFSVVFSKLIMVCLYGDAYYGSTVYFMIKNLSSIVYVVPFAPIMLAIGKTKDYANIHMIAAIFIVCLQFICVKLLDSPVAIAVVSGGVQILIVFLMMLIISRYACRTILNLLPLRHLGKILFSCILAALISYIISNLFICNKFLLASVCVVLFSFLYLGLCWVLKISYRDLVSGLVQKNNKPLLRILP